jgi:hypothetical protein
MPATHDRHPPEISARDGLLVLVPSRGIIEIGLGERPNDEAAGHRCLLAAVELLAEALLDNLPAFTGAWVGVEVL